MLKVISSIRELPDNVQFTVSQNPNGSTSFVAQDTHPFSSGVNIYLVSTINYYDSPHRNIVTEGEFNFIITGQKIQAIKAFRERTGYGIKFSKDIIDMIGDSLVKGY